MADLPRETAAGGPSDRDAAVAAYFQWNSDGLVGAVSALSSAAILLAFAMLDRLADAGLGYASRTVHLVLMALAVALAAPVGLRNRRAMLALRPMTFGIALACLGMPAFGWRLIPPAPGVTAHLPAFAVILAIVAFVPAAGVLAATRGPRWQAFRAYCRTPSVWNRPRDTPA